MGAEFENYKERVKEQIIKESNPTYIVLLNWIQKHTMLPHYFVALFLGIAFYMGGVFVAYFSGTSISENNVFWLRTNASAIIVGVLLFLRFAYLKGLNSLSEFLSLCKTKEQVQRIKRSYKLMFNVKLQTIYGIGMVFIGEVCFYLLGLPFGPLMNSWYYLAAAFIFFFLMQGVYLMIALMIFIYNMSNGDMDYNLSPLNPSESLGIKEMANVASVYALLTFGGALLFLIGLILGDWVNHDTSGTMIILFWTLLLIFWVIFNFVFPHICMKRIITYSKRNTSRKLMKIMEDCVVNFGKKTVSETEKLQLEIDLLTSIDEAYTSLSKSRNYALDLSLIAQFLSALIVPVIILMFEDPELFRVAIDFFVSIIENIFMK